MLKWALIAAVIVFGLGALMFSGILAGPAQAPGILIYLAVAAVILAVLARSFVFKKMK